MEIVGFLLCMLHGYTHSVAEDTEFKLFYPGLSSPETDFSEDTKVFYSGSPVHLLPISGHGIPVGSQHLLSGRQGSLYFFRWEFQAGKAKDDWPVVRHKTSWSRNLRALSKFPGWCLSCLSRLSVIFCCCSDPICLSAVPASAPWVFMLLPVLMSHLMWVTEIPGEEEFEVSQTMVWLT